MDKKTTHSNFKSYAPRQRTVRPRPEPPKPEKKHRSLLKNTVTCAIIALLVWGLSVVDTPFTNDMTDTLQQAVSKNAEFDEIGKLKFVDSENIKTDGFTMPLEGQVLTAFADSGKDTVIKSVQGSAVYCILAGTVSNIGENQITIKSEDGTKTTYKGIEPAVEEDEKLAVSGQIGTLEGNELRIEMVRKGKYIDPLKTK